MQVLLARAAFSLMDEDGDGELTLAEMAASFRHDERVRKLLLPLLPLPTSKRQTIYAAGDAMGQMIAAFEALFTAMDTDGEGMVLLGEWIDYLAREEVKAKTRKGADLEKASTFRDGAESVAVTREPPQDRAAEGADAEEEEEGAHEAGATEEAGMEGGASNVGTVTLSAGKARAADRPSARAGAAQGAVARSLEQERL